MPKLLRDASTQRPTGQCEGRDGVGKFAALSFVWNRSLLLPRLRPHHRTFNFATAGYRVMRLGRSGWAMDMREDARGVVVRFCVARSDGRPAFPSSTEAGEQGRRCRAILTSKHASLAVKREAASYILGVRIRYGVSIRCPLRRTSLPWETKSATSC
jgi:hypothetical protein